MSTASNFASTAAGRRARSTITTTQPPRVTGQTTAFKAATTTSFTQMTAVINIKMSKQRVEQLPMKVFFKPIPQVLKKYCEYCKQQFVYGWCHDCECCMDCCPDYIDKPPDVGAPVVVAEGRPCYGH
ncbi:hypothetical protein KI688_004376 [Linnemannia hyalina]|uniref:Uncharacterized protein n=1 Tax=Linnemannia hyalina TaxID=64524 RepID=A0A9P8BS25_9FUNG|nr:hypothetical protein KI688_004376 [Linnemannia hyalina]